MFGRRKGEEEVVEEEDEEEEEDPAAYWSRACTKEGGASTSMALFSPKAASANNAFGATGPQPRNTPQSLHCHAA
eukprot:evm.model.NODE_29862_length_11657_cov_29.889936.2